MYASSIKTIDKGQMISYNILNEFLYVHIIAHRTALVNRTFNIFCTFLKLFFWYCNFRKQNWNFSAAAVPSPPKIGGSAPSSGFRRPSLRYPKFVAPRKLRRQISTAARWSPSLLPPQAAVRLQPRPIFGNRGKRCGGVFSSYLLNILLTYRTGFAYLRRRLAFACGKSYVNLRRTSAALNSRRELCDKNASIFLPQYPANRRRL